MRINPPLLALALGAFGIGVTEFAPMGMLPGIAAGVHASLPAAGLLVSAYALGVFVCAPLLTLTTGRWDRRTLLIALMGLFTIGNGLSAAAASYGVLLAARVVTSMNHGAFFGVGALVAAGLAPPERRAGAVAAMFSGLTLATVGGVPLATWVGGVLGWRTTFAGIAALGAVIMLALRLALPPLPAEAAAGDAGAELRTLREPRVLGALALTTLGFSAVFTVFTFIVPMLKAVTHASDGFVTAMLVVFGVGATIGNALGGRLANRSVPLTLLAMLALLAATLAAFSVLLPWPAPTALAVFVWGVASFATVPPLQTQVMRAAEDAPNLASAMNIGAFNLGNAIGAAAGGAALAMGWRLAALPLVGAGLAAAAVLACFAFNRAPGQPIKQALGV